MLAFSTIFVNLDYNGSIPRATSSNDEQPSYNGSKTFMHIISSPETLWTYVLTEPNWSAGKYRLQCVHTILVNCLKSVG
jgi:hypothetical protein